MEDEQAIIQTLDAIADPTAAKMAQLCAVATADLLAVAQNLNPAQIQALDWDLAKPLEQQIYALWEKAAGAGEQQGIKAMIASLPAEVVQQAIESTPLESQFAHYFVSLSKFDKSLSERILSAIRRLLGMKSRPTGFRNLPAEEVIRQRSAVLAGKFAADQLFTLKQDLLASITPQADGAPISRKELLARIEQNLGVSRVRSQMIARTETTIAYNRGRLSSYKRSPLVTHVQFLAISDDRTTPICKSRNGMIISIADAAAIAKNTPALHVNCRSVISPILSPAVISENRELIEDPSRSIANRVLEPLPPGWNQGDESAPTGQFQAVQPQTFAPKKTPKKKRNCPKGTPCGGSCISAKKTCRKGMSAKQLAAHKKALKLARAAKKQPQTGTAAPAVKQPERFVSDAMERAIPPDSWVAANAVPKRFNFLPPATNAIPREVKGLRNYSGLNEAQFDALAEKGQVGGIRPKMQPPKTSWPSTFVWTAKPQSFVGVGLNEGYSIADIASFYRRRYASPQAIKLTAKVDKISPKEAKKRLLKEASDFFSADLAKELQAVSNAQKGKAGKSQPKTTKAIDQKIKPGLHEYYLVDVASITSTSAQKNKISKAEIEARANEIIANKGLLEPLLLEQDSVISYQTIGHDLDFFASQEARRRDPRGHEVVAAFVSRSQQATEEIKRQDSILAKHPRDGDPASLRGKEHEYYLVDVAAITSKITQKYTDDQIDELAESIDRLNGLTRPILLRETSPQTYEVVSGHLEFLAAQKARQSDPKRNEMVSAFVYKAEKKTSSGTTEADFDLNQEGTYVAKGAFGIVRLVPGPPPAAIKKGEIDPSEIAILKELSDSGYTPKFIKADLTGEQAQLAMTVVPGLPLGRIKKLRPKEQQQFEAEFLKATKDLHNRGFAHNDIHAGNVFFERETAKVNLIDFGRSQKDPVLAYNEALFISKRMEDYLLLSPNTKKRLRAAQDKAFESMEKDGIYDKGSDQLTPQQAKKYLKVFYSELP
ncbi:MAG: minor capsid protein [Synechococcales cyanobacterium RU_4_20]|nr:minor capsid protein [Synechococcales cyanobacterium RU_4_20]